LPGLIREGDSAQQRSKLLPLVVVERRERFALRGANDRSSFFVESLTRGGRADALGPPIARIGLAADEAAILELVHERDDLARIEHEELRELALRWRLLAAGEGQYGVRTHLQSKWGERGIGACDTHRARACREELDLVGQLRRLELAHAIRRLHDGCLAGSVIGAALVRDCPPRGFSLRRGRKGCWRSCKSLSSSRI